MTALMDAAALVADVRAERLLAGDTDTAARLAELHRHLADEHEYLIGIEQFDLPTTDRTYPPGACIGFLLRHDPHVRALRRLRGLPVPEEVHRAA